jgi:menaquinone-dependent protoporphyrinogen IX oxidase
VKILVSYGTSEGQTKKIAERVAAHVQELGHDADLFDTASIPTDLHVGSYDKIIIAGSVHQQRHQESVEVFVTAKLAELQKRLTLFHLLAFPLHFPKACLRHKAISRHFSKTLVGALQNHFWWRGHCVTLNMTISGSRSSNTSF